MPFAVPMVWREQKDHLTDCYFCLTKIDGFNQKTRDKVKYKFVASAMQPYPHSDELPVPASPEVKTSLSYDEDMQPVAEGDEAPCDKDYLTQCSSAEPKLFTQAGLNDLVRDLRLAKRPSELLGSRLQERNLLMPDVNITSFRDRNNRFSKHFASEGELCYCKDVDGLFNEYNIKNNPEEWRLFIDSSKRSLKAVLLHNGNKYPSLPMAYSIHLKETYETMSRILEAIRYNEYKWVICSDLKVVAMICGMQTGYTKYMCPLCLWGSRKCSEHWTRKVWPARTDFKIGKFNIAHEPLVPLSASYSHRCISNLDS